MSDDRKIALDVGNVSVQLSVQKTMKLLRIDSMETLPAYFRENWMKLETGEVSDVEFLEAFRASFDCRFSHAELIDMWNDIIGETVPGMYEAVSKCAAEGVRFYFFSNTSRLHAEEFLRKCSFAHLVSGSVYSFEAGCMKPDPRIYEIFEERYGRPDFFFDDRLENIEAACKRGWNAVQFHSVQDFTRALEAFGPDK